AQWLAYAIPYRRFADALADTCARLGDDVVRYSFIVVDLHHLLLAGLPAHPCSNLYGNARRDGLQPLPGPGRGNQRLLQIVLAQKLPVPVLSHPLGTSQMALPCPTRPLGLKG